MGPIGKMNLIHAFNMVSETYYKLAFRHIAGSLLKHGLIHSSMQVGNKSGTNNVDRTLCRSRKKFKQELGAKVIKVLQRILVVVATDTGYLGHIARL